MNDSNNDQGNKVCFKLWSLNSLHNKEIHIIIDPLHNKEVHIIIDQRKIQSSLYSNF